RVPPPGRPFGAGDGHPLQDQPAHGPFLDRRRARLAPPGRAGAEAQARPAELSRRLRSSSAPARDAAGPDYPPSAPAEVLQRWRPRPGHRSFSASAEPMKRFLATLLTTVAVVGVFAAGDAPAPSPADALQAAMDAAPAPVPNGPGKTVVVPPGTMTLPRPLWLPGGVDLVAADRSSALKPAGGFPAVITGLARPPAGWEAAQNVAGGVRIAGGSYAIFPRSGLDLGPWRWGLGAPYLAGWDAARQLKIHVTLQLDDPTWPRQPILTVLDAQGNPAPWRLWLEAPGKMTLEGIRSDGAKINADWSDTPTSGALDL